MRRMHSKAAAGRCAWSAAVLGMVALSLPRKVAGQEVRTVRHESRVAAAP